MKIGEGHRLDNIDTSMPKEELAESLRIKSMEKVNKDLELIKGSLKDFVQHIINEQPDEVVFLDKGARLFGTPVKKYLESLDLAKVPHISFFNDDFIKGKYKNGELDPETIQKELGFLEGKKIFFFDDTFHEGTGAAWIELARETLKNEDISYFAMSVTPSFAGKDFKGAVNKSNGMSMPDFHREILDKVRESNNFKIYGNEVQNLFSRSLSYKYIWDFPEGGKQTTRHNTITGFNIMDYKKDFAMVAEIKKKIFEAIKL